MMRKYFPLEASERLFVAIEEDDVVDAQVSLPPTIALSCTTEIIHDNYALCLQFWLNGVDRQELLRLVRKQAKGDELLLMSANNLNTCERATSTCVLRNGCI